MDSHSTLVERSTPKKEQKWLKYNLVSSTIGHRFLKKPFLSLHNKKANSVFV